MLYGYMSMRLNSDVAALGVVRQQVECMTREVRAGACAQKKPAGRVFRLLDFPVVKT